jgi:hypothetical protein
VLARDGAATVDGLAQRVDHPAEQPVADRHRQDGAGGPHGLALLDVLELAQHHCTDRVLVEVEREALHAALELQQLVHRHVGKAGDARDAVADLGDTAHLLLLEAGLVALEGRAQRSRDVVRIEIERVGHERPLFDIYSPSLS